MSEAQATTKPMPEPETLLEAVVYFQNPDNCIRYLAAHRWSDGVPVCPTCGSKDIGFIASRRMFQCKTRHPKAQFSIKLGTIFEDSPLGLDKWLPAMWMIASNATASRPGNFTARRSHPKDRLVHASPDSPCDAG